MAVDLGPNVRVGVYTPGPAGYRMLAVGSAPSTLDAPHFDLTPAYEAALTDAASRGGSFAFPQPPYDAPLADRAPAAAAITGDGVASGPSVFLFSDLGVRDLDALIGLLHEAGFTDAGRAGAAVRGFRDRVDGPAAVRNIAARAPDLILIALANDTAGDSLDYVIDLLVAGLAGHEAGYRPRVTVLHGGSPPAAALERLHAVLPTAVHRMHGGTPTEPLDLEVPGVALHDAARAVHRAHWAGRGLPPRLARAPHVARASALQAAARALSASQELGVGVVSFDAADVTAVTARGSATQLTRSAAARAPSRAFHLGLSTPIDRVARWTTEELLPETLHGFVFEQTAHPTSIPTTTFALQLAHAVWAAAARDALRRTASGSANEEQAVDLAVMTGDVTRTIARPMQAALLLINSLELAGITQLALDAANGLAMSGALLQTGRTVAVESSLIQLGACVALRGEASPGDAAVAVEVLPAGAAPIEREVSAGALDVIQWEPGVEASVRLWPSPKFDVGLGYGRPVHLRAPLASGSVGLVVDARGRPLVWPEDADVRQARTEQWYRALNAYATAQPRRRQASHAA